MNRRSLAAAAMLIAAASFTIASGSSASSGSASGGGSQSGQTFGLNQPARDGDLEFTVKSVKCGVAKVGGTYGSKAKGQFCLATMNVKNVGKEAHTFSAASQEAKNGDIVYDADGDASIDANKEPNAFEEFNAGNSIDVVVVYDIPKDAKIQTLVLHDSVLGIGDGVQVKVS